MQFSGVPHFFSYGSSFFFLFPFTLILFLEALRSYVEITELRGVLLKAKFNRKWMHKIGHNCSLAFALKIMNRSVTRFSFDSFSRKKTMLFVRYLDILEKNLTQGYICLWQVEFDVQDRVVHVSAPFVGNCQSPSVMKVKYIMWIVLK